MLLKTFAYLFVLCMMFKTFNPWMEPCFGINKWSKELVNVDERIPFTSLEHELARQEVNTASTAVDATCPRLLGTMANFKEVDTMVGQLACRRKLQLTGTPVQNDLGDYFNLVKEVEIIVEGKLAMQRLVESTRQIILRSDVINNISTCRLDGSTAPHTRPSLDMQRLG